MGNVKKKYEVPVIGYEYERPKAIMPLPKFINLTEVNLSMHAFIDQNVRERTSIRNMIHRPELFQFYDGKVKNWESVYAKYIIYNKRVSLPYNYGGMIEKKDKKLSDYLKKDVSEYYPEIINLVRIKSKNEVKPISTHIDTRTHDIVAHQTRILNGEEPVRFCKSKKCAMCENINRIWALKDKARFITDYNEFCHPVARDGYRNEKEVLDDSERTAITTKDKFSHTKYIKPDKAQVEVIEGPLRVTPRLRCGHLTSTSHHDIITFRTHRNKGYIDNSHVLNEFKEFTRGKHSLVVDADTDGRDYMINESALSAVRTRLNELGILQSAKIYHDDDMTQAKKDTMPIPYSMSVEEKQRFAEIQLKRIITYVRTSNPDKYDHPQIKLCDIDRSDICLLTQKLAGSFRTWEELYKELDDIYVIMEGLAGTYTPNTTDDCLLENWELKNRVSMFPDKYDLDLSVLVESGTPELSELEKIMERMKI